MERNQKKEESLLPPRGGLAGWLLSITDHAFLPCCVFWEIRQPAHLPLAFLSQYSTSLAKQRERQIWLASTTTTLSVTLKPMLCSACSHWLEGHPLHSHGLVLVYPHNPRVTFYCTHSLGPVSHPGLLTPYRWPLHQNSSVNPWCCQTVSFLTTSPFSCEEPAWHWYHGNPPVYQER